MNPLDPRLVPSPNFEGKAFPATDMYRYPITMPAGALVIATNAGDVGTVLAVYNRTAGSCGVYSLPTLASGPTSGRAMKASLSLVNTTPAIHRGGSVYQANFNQRLEFPAAPAAMTTVQWEALISELIAHPDCIERTAEEFCCHTDPLIAYPTDSTAYHGYSDWKTGITKDEFFEHVAQWPGSEYRPRPMSTLVYVIGPQGTTNTYSATVRASYYTRWPVDTVPGRQSRIVPTADPSKVAKIHATAWQVAEATVAGAAVAVAAGARAMASRVGTVAGEAFAEPLLMPLLPLAAV
jgi:hypothetical protein